MSGQKRSRFSRRAFLKTAAATGALAAVGSAQAAPSVTVYVYQNIPANLDQNNDIDDIFGFAKSGLQETLNDLESNGVVGGWSLVERLDPYPNIAASSNSQALTEFQKWLWNNGYKEGTSLTSENAGHILVRDSSNAANPGGFASGASVWYNDGSHSVSLDYNDDGFAEVREAVPRGVIADDLDGFDEDPDGIPDWKEIETAAAHEFGHLVIEGGDDASSNSDCWTKTFNVSNSHSNEHVLATWSDTRGERSIMGRHNAAVGGEPCANSANGPETGLWHSSCYVDLAKCTRDYYQ